MNKPKPNPTIILKELALMLNFTLYEAFMGKGREWGIRKIKTTKELTRINYY